MRYGVLGPVELHHEAQPVPLAGVKQRRLLAVLLLHRGRVVTIDRLVDAMWGGDPPVDAPSAVQVHVSRLRAVLRSTGAPDPVRTRSNGYLFDVPADNVDLDRFRVLVAEGDDDLAHGRPEQAARAATGALALWRGAPLADVQPAGRQWPELDGVEELRRAALGVRFDAELALGRGETLLAELHTLLAEDPLRERTRGQLMLALARSGRRAEALELYRDGRELSVDGLGLEPGQTLRGVHAAVLADRLYGVSPGPVVAWPESRASAALRRAAEFAARVGAPGEAARCWQALLDTLPAEDPARAEILLRLGESLYHAEAGGREALLEAHSLFSAERDDEAMAETEMLLGRVDWLAGRGAAARRHIDRAVELVRNRPESPATVAVLTASSGYLAVFGRRQEAVRMGHVAAALAEAMGSEELAARARANTGMARIMLGDPSAEQDLRLALDVYTRQRGWAPAAIHANLFAAHAYQADLPGASAAFTEQLQAARLAASQSDERWCLMHRCYLAWWAGDIQTTRRTATALVSDEVNGNHPYHSQSAAHLYLARIALLAGDRQEAEHHGEVALSRARAGDDDQFVIPALGFAAHLHLRHGREPAARVLVAEALHRLSGRAIPPAAGTDLPVAMARLHLGRAALSGVTRTPWSNAATLVLAKDLTAAEDAYRTIGSTPDAEAVTQLRRSRSSASAGRPAT